MVMQFHSFVFVCVFIFIVGGSVGDGIFGLMMVTAQASCVTCVETEGKSFCPTISSRRKITNALTLNSKPNDSKAHQCRGSAYVLTHSCDYNDGSKSGWINKAENCPDWGDIDAATIKTLTHSEKKTWTKTEATAATIRILKTAFIGVSIASSFGAVSVGGPVLITGMVSFWLYEIAENRHKLAYEQLLTMCQDAIGKLQEPMMKLSDVENKIINMRETFRKFKQEKFPKALKGLSHRGSEECVAAREEAMQSISSDTNVKETLISLIDAGCLAIPDVLSESTKADLDELINDIRSSSESSSDSGDGVALTKRINDIEEEGGGYLSQEKLALWKLQASHYVTLFTVAQSRDVELANLGESVANTITRLDDVARNALKMMNEHVRSHVLNEKAESAATATDYTLTGVQIIAGINLAAHTGEIGKEIMNQLQEIGMSALVEVFSGTLSDKIKTIDDGLVSATEYVDEKGDEAMKALGNVVKQAKEQASETYTSLFSSNKKKSSE